MLCFRCLLSNSTSCRLNKFKKNKNKNAKKTENEKEKTIFLFSCICKNDLWNVCRTTKLHDVIIVTIATTKSPNKKVNREHIHFTLIIAQLPLKCAFENKHFYFVWISESNAFKTEEKKAIIFLFSFHPSLIQMHEKFILFQFQMFVVICIRLIQGKCVIEKK